MDSEQSKARRADRIPINIQTVEAQQSTFSLFSGQLFTRPPSQSVRILVSVDIFLKNVASVCCPLQLPRLPPFRNLSYHPKCRINNLQYWICNTHHLISSNADFAQLPELAVEDTKDSAGLDRFCDRSDDMTPDQVTTLATGKIEYNTIDVSLSTVFHHKATDTTPSRLISVLAHGTALDYT